ncbi:MAG: hypothetical protein K0S47_3704 [Herbinix sp.]|jgi:phosphoribosylcarboxyaminoimidazole (NCAIR) mutase|nr:hypothetical protein [Herbinix sp.]
MYSFGNNFGNSFTDNAAVTGLGLASLIASRNEDLDERLNQLDENTRAKVKKHLNEFQTVEEMEMFIKQVVGKDIPTT